MPLEAVMICMDNSEFMRNGDYAPTRIACQNEAINNIVSLLLDANVESSVGLMCMSGKVEVLVSLTRNVSAIMTSLSKQSIQGTCNYLAALKTAQLALKNRANKSQKQRIILFVGSPMHEDVKELVKMGKLLKKNGVALDVVNFGAENSSNDNCEKLQQLVDSVKSEDNSHLVNIPPGPHNLSDMVITSEIMIAGGSNGSNMGMGSMSGDMMSGMEDDPELAMALRMSMEEERQRQQQVQQQQTQASSSSSSSIASPAPQTPQVQQQQQPQAQAQQQEDTMMYDDEEDEIARAIALSLQEHDAPETPAPAQAQTTQTQPAQTQSADTQMNVSTSDIAAVVQDDEFMNELLESVGVNRDDVDIDNLLEQLTDNNDKDKKKDDKNKDNKDNQQEKK